MRISKYANAKSFDDPLVYYRIHENNFSKKNDKIYFDEYYDWFYSQKKRKDKLFQENIKYFQLRLSKLQITYLLFKKKNLMLFKQIVKYPILSHKIKFFLAFLLPSAAIKSNQIPSSEHCSTGPVLVLLVAYYTNKNILQAIYY